MKVKNTLLQNVIEAITLITIITMILMVVLSWDKMPEKIPLHYNLRGEIDDWGNRNAVLISPVIGVACVAGLTAVSRLPKLWNMAVEPNENNKKLLYASVKNLLIWLKLEFALIFFYLTYTDIKGQALSPYFTLIELAALFGTLAYFLYDQAMINRYTKGKIVIDSEVTRLKNTFPVSKFWLIVPCLLVVMPYFLLETKNGGNGFVFAFAFSVEVASFAAGYVYSTRMKPKVFTKNERDNMTLNRLRIRGISRFFVQAAYIAAIAGIICYNDLYMNDLVLTETVCLVYPIHIGLILLLFGMVKSKMNKAEYTIVQANEP